jgi:hypothetical protein
MGRFECGTFAMGNVTASPNLARSKIQKV